MFLINYITITRTQKLKRVIIQPKAFLSGFHLKLSESSFFKFLGLLRTFLLRVTKSNNCLYITELLTIICINKRHEQVIAVKLYICFNKFTRQFLAVVKSISSLPLGNKPIEIVFANLTSRKNCNDSLHSHCVTDNHIPIPTLLVKIQVPIQVKMPEHQHGYDSRRLL